MCLAASKLLSKHKIKEVDPVVSYLTLFYIIFLFLSTGNVGIKLYLAINSTPKV
jgi:hypothetical protein